MQLFRFGPKGQENPGVVVDGVHKDCSAHFEDWNRDFFNDDGMSQLRALVEKKGEGLPNTPADARLGACVARPHMLMCIGLNYSDHAAESGMEPPDKPVIFQKSTSAVSGPFDDVTIPKNSTKTDWEVELGVVIGKDTKQSIAKKIGLPATAGLEGAYYYVRSTFNAPGFKSAQLVDRTVVVLSFDQRSKLKNIETFNVDNGNFVRLDYRVTETGLDNKNILQQIIGSISGPSASGLGM